MVSSRTIRIDQEVRTELQRRARPLEDTPNSVLRRVLGLPEILRIVPMDRRVAKLLALVQDSVGQALQRQADEKGYALLDRTGKAVAYIRPGTDKLRVLALKEHAEKAGLNNWENQRRDRSVGTINVRWYVRDGDESAYKHVAEVLEKLWNIE